jgi:tripartite-type tricarboxylate transporter receptor subunit TctC
LDIREINLQWAAKAVHLAIVHTATKHQRHAMVRLPTVLMAALAVLALHAPVRAAEDYPSKPITIVVSLAAGTGMDVLTRLYAEKLSQALGKPVIVENKPGAATTLAANQVANAPADGHTLVVLTSIALAINPTLYKHLNYAPGDFVPISLYVKSPFILSTYPGLPAKTVPPPARRTTKACPGTCC